MKDIKTWVTDNNINVRRSSDGPAQLSAYLIIMQYTVLSDEKGDARKAFQCGKGLMGLTEGRISFVVDNKGVVRYVLLSVLGLFRIAENMLIVMSWTP